MQLILDTKGLKLTKKRNSFLVEPEEGSSRLISPKKLSSIAITQQVWISSDAVMLAIKNEIPILFFDRIGKAKGRLWSPYFESIATLRRQQIRFGDSPKATTWIISLFEMKTEEQLRNLSFFQNRRPGIAEDLQASINKMKAQQNRMKQMREKEIEAVRQPLMGIEGGIARSYWQGISSALPEAYQFKKRSRRPALDHFNAALNYLYGMLYSIVEGAIFAAGLDPHLGILHSDQYNKPTLAFDLIEPFRPWIDRLLIEECMIHNLEAAFFTKNQYGLFLNKQGKAYIIPLFNDYLRSTKRYFGRDTSIRNHIYTLAARLAQRIRTFDQDPEVDIEESPTEPQN